MKHYFKYLILLLLPFCVAISHAESAPPVAMLDSVAKEVISSLEKNRANLKSNPSVVYKIIDAILLPHVDVVGMSRSVLGRANWQKANAAEKNTFTREFTRLVVRTYAGALTDYSGEKLKFFPLTAGYEAQPFVQVKSLIVRPNGRNIPLSYSLVRSGENWKIYDMSVEGVSLLQSFRSQFSAELSHGSLQQLLDKLSKHNDKTHERG